MSPDTLFLLCNYGVLPAWLLLVIAPRWEWTERLVQRVWIPGVLALVYGAAFLASPALPEGGGFGSLSAVRILFASPWVALAGWIHYLAFDLFIGAWEVRDAERRGLHHGFVVPCLLLTLMLGPLGLLLYFLVRAARLRVVTLGEEEAAS